MSEIQLAENSSTPSVPPTGYVSLYVKSDGLWYGQDAAGTESPISQASAQQALDIAANTGKVGITQAQADAIVANTAKVSDVNHVTALLPNAENTADLDKPISTLVQAALNLLSTPTPNPCLSMPLVNDLHMLEGQGAVTTARSTAATIRDKSLGTIQSVNADELRVESDGLLIENSVSNQMLQSGELDNVAWQNGATLMNANVVTSPDGTVDGDEIAGIGAMLFISRAIAVPDNTHITFSVFVKTSGSASDSSLQLTFNSGTFIQQFDSNLGTLGVSSGSLASVSKSRIVDYGNGWYRVSITVATSIGDSSANCYIVSSNAITGNLYVFGAQLEASPVATSYIATTNASVSRGADVASIDIKNLPYLAFGCTVSCKANVPYTTNKAYLIYAGTGLFIARLVSGVMQGALGGVIITTTTTPDEALHEFTLRTDGTTHELLMDGTVIGSATGTLTQPNVPIYLGSSNGLGSFLNGHIKDFRIWNQPLTNHQIGAL